jgi:hypothetical protein
MQSVQGTIPSEVKLIADFHLLSIADVKNEWNFASTCPLRLQDAVPRQLCFALPTIILFWRSITPAVDIAS